jgi:hypothetical protein
VVITCNDNYVPLAIVALSNFVDKNPHYDRYIIGIKFTDASKALAAQYDATLIEVDLRKDFTDLDKRVYGRQYPIECFYHFYAYKVLTDYDFIVSIEPDVYTNRALDIDLNTITYIGGSCTHTETIRRFTPFTSHLPKIRKVFGNFHLDQPRIRGGFRIYNVKNLLKIGFYERVVEYYQKSLRLGAQRCGDDSMMVFYQSLHPSHFQFLGRAFNVIGNITLGETHEVYHFHFGGPTEKPWKKSSRERTDGDRYFTDRYIEFVYDHFDPDFIKKYLPSI